MLILLQGYVFVDRDGKHFRHILNWLRDGVVPTLEDNEYSELLREAEYYQLLVSHSIFHVQIIHCLASFFSLDSWFDINQLNAIGEHFPASDYRCSARMMIASLFLESINFHLGIGGHSLFWVK